jgi:hypothetical protein
MKTLTRTMWVAGLAPVLAGALVTPANAGQRGAPVYPLGVDTLYPADLPPVSGLFLLVYGLDYQIDNVKDGKGDNLFGDFSGRVTGIGFRPVYVWKTSILGAKPVSYVVIPIVNRHFSAGTINIPGGPTIPFSAVNLGDRSQNNTGISDISVGQVLSWHMQHGISTFVGFEAGLPTGDYNKNRFFNIASTNYFTFAPNVGVTWRSSHNDHASLKVQYSFTTQNRQDAPGSLAPGLDLAKYKSGDFLTVEYAAGVGLTKRLGLDVAGFAMVQTVDDKQNSVRLSDSKSRLFAIGPQLRYNVGPGAVAFKVEHEFGGRNSPQGNRIFFQFGIPLSVPKGPPPQ